LHSPYQTFLLGTQEKDYQNVEKVALGIMNNSFPENQSHFCVIHSSKKSNLSSISQLMLKYSHLKSQTNRKL